MPTELGAGRRRDEIENRSTAVLTHYGRKSGRPYHVRIWFTTEDDNVYLATTNSGRQWVRNLRAKPQVALRVGDKVFHSLAEELTGHAEREHVFRLMASKYPLALPMVLLRRLLGWLMPDRAAAFRLRV